MAKMKFPVMKLTDAAADRVREILENSDKPALGLRVGVNKGGCAGMEYSMDIVEEASAGDDVIEEKGVTLFVDPAAVLFLLGTEMDYEVTKFRSGFVFRNPNEVSACGCGESVELKQADPSLLAS
ncbi:Fe-S cluster assembly scaffold SufA [Rhizobiales bacterium]|uniref:Fe-S cluster assembly scaffold SufA n=1 Tax=Hongsoonwoonella zoysiae TaxID=2821844 RepID=UPI00155FFF51|nr:Fe-S cluster assembly scaffold SufA [Hongsoonwoonella zoysiae]NRG18887.1 Fe-S cluster assembly scaffold SufA [Hongsoonwoonella zoysiae]